MKKLYVFLLAVTISLFAFADNGLLWKVTGNELSKPSYILGSHHMVPAEFVDSIAGLLNAIDEVEAVYGEVTKNALSSPDMQQMMMTYAMAPVDSTLSKVLTEDELSRLDHLLETYTGMPGMAMQFDPLKPAMVSSQIAILQMMKEFPEFQMLQPFDGVVMSLGEAKGKAMGGLESPESQMALIFGDPVNLQAKDLMETVDNNDKLVEQVKNLTDSYLKQDLDAVTEVVTDASYGVTPDALERLIYRRNHAWAEVLEDVLPRQSVLVVVGCGHLGGEEGLLNLLRKEGYNVIPVNE